MSNTRAPKMSRDIRFGRELRHKVWPRLIARQLRLDTVRSRMRSRVISGAGWRLGCAMIGTSWPSRKRGKGDIQLFHKVGCPLFRPPFPAFSGPARVKRSISRSIGRLHSSECAKKHSFPRSAWECRPRRSASSGNGASRGVRLQTARRGRRASRTAFPRRAWEQVGTKSRITRRAQSLESWRPEEWRPRQLPAGD